MLVFVDLKLNDKSFNLVPRVSPLHARGSEKRRDPGNEGLNQFVDTVSVRGELNFDGMLN